MMMEPAGVAPAASTFLTETSFVVGLWLILVCHLFLQTALAPEPLANWQWLVSQPSPVPD